MSSILTAEDTTEVLLTSVQSSKVKRTAYASRQRSSDDGTALSSFLLIIPK